MGHRLLAANYVGEIMCCNTDISFAVRCQKGAAQICHDESFLFVVVRRSLFSLTINGLYTAREQPHVFVQWKSQDKHSSKRLLIPLLLSAAMCQKKTHHHHLAGRVIEAASFIYRRQTSLIVPSSSEGNKTAAESILVLFPSDANLPKMSASMELFGERRGDSEQVAGQKSFDGLRFVFDACLGSTRSSTNQR